MKNAKKVDLFTNNCFFGTPGFLRCSYALGDEDLEEGLSRLSQSLDKLL